MSWVSLGTSMYLWRWIRCFYCGGGQTAIMICPINLVVGNRSGHFNFSEAALRPGYIPFQYCTFYNLNKYYFSSYSQVLHLSCDKPAYVSACYRVRAFPGGLEFRVHIFCPKVLVAYSDGLLHEIKLVWVFSQQTMILISHVFFPWKHRLFVRIKKITLWKTFWKPINFFQNIFIGMVLLFWSILILSLMSSFRRPKVRACV